MTDDAPITGLACPSPIQCTAVAGGANGGGGSANEVTFNPQSPVPAPSVVTLADTQTVAGVACPSVVQCTAIDEGGDELSFNPQAPGTPTRVAIGHSLTSVSCPSQTLCAATDGASVVAFNPESPGSSTSIQRPRIGASDRLGTVSCPSVTDCVATTSFGAVQGDPTGKSAWTVEPIPPEKYPGVGLPDHLVSLDCPSASECVAMTYYSEEITGTSATPSKRGAASVGRVAVSGDAASALLRCRGAGTQTCRERVTLRQSGSHAAVLGTTTVTVAGGRNRTVRVSLNRSGRKLLARRGRLTIRLVVAGATDRKTVARRTLTFKTKHTHTG
jgi:hypothetical protein